MQKSNTGVYMFQSISIPERVYIGSATDISVRLKDHLNLLRNNKHHSPKLQHHYNKYGEDDLEFSIIECGEYLCEQHLLAREQGWFIPYEYGDTELPYFNICKIAGSRKGHKASIETRMKMSKSRIGNTNSKGHVTSDETKEKIKQGLAKRDPSYREKLSIAATGRKHTDEAKKKISDANKGRTFSKETLKRMSESAKKREKHFGRMQSEESRRKMSETKRIRREERGRNAEI